MRKEAEFEPGSDAETRTPDKIDSGDGSERLIEPSRSPETLGAAPRSPFSDEMEEHSPICTCCCGEGIGNTRRFYSCGEHKDVDKDVRTFPRRCMLGPDWPCLICTYSLIIVPSLLFLFLVASNMETPILIAGIVVGLFAFVSLTLTACSDPGILKKRTHVKREILDAERLEMASDHTLCSKCRVWRDYTTQHCTWCNVCVVGLDHHCPWTGKCIGKYNLRFFYMFLWSILFFMLFVLGCTFAFLISG